MLGNWTKSAGSYLRWTSTPSRMDSDALFTTNLISQLGLRKDLGVDVFSFTQLVFQDKLRIDNWLEKGNTA